MLSVVIPSFKDKYLQPTVQSLLDNAHGEIEVIVVFDGHEQTLKEDPRVHTISLPKQGGQKNAFCTGVKMARGEYIARSDEHCLFGPGFDLVLTENMEDNWVVTPRRYFLDPEKWAIMPEKGHVDYEELVIAEKPHLKKFSGHKWKSRHNRKEAIDETMMMQGSFWVCKKDWFDTVVGEFDSDRYGDHYQDQAELVFKTWKAGGNLMVNKNTYFAHKHRDFSRTHHYSHQKAQPGWTAMIEDWGEYFEKEIVPRFKNVD